MPYPDLSVQVYDSQDGNKPLTVNDAKELLGWSTPPEGVTKGVHKIGKVRAWMSRNNINRPLYMGCVDRYKQEILRRKWRMNGEPIIVGKQGNVLNGQHTLIALVLAGMELEEHPGKWKEYWQTEPTIDKVCVFGVGGNDDVINTMDTCKPRSFADVIYRSSFFAKVGSSKRKTCARALDYAVRLMWHRTGASLDAFRTSRTHAEALGFIERHPKLIEAVSFIVDEDSDGSISRRWLTHGYATAMLYLMGCCRSDEASYYTNDVREESVLDFDMWEAACDFWVGLSQNAEQYKPMRTALSRMQEPNWKERCALIAKGWLCVAQGRKLAAKELKLKYTEPDNEEDAARLAECPTVGGIDRGDPQEEESKSKPSKGSKSKSTTNLKAHRAGPKWSKGDTAWVKDEDEPFFAELVEDPYDTDGDYQMVTVEENGNRWDVLVDNLFLDKSKAA